MADIKLVLDSFFKCQLNNNNDAGAHILKEPRVLPCGYTVCKECIINSMQNTKKFKCTFDKCQNEHQINDVEQLGQNHLVAAVLNDNTKYLSRDLLNKLKIEFERFIDINALNENKTKISTIFEFIEGDIVIRIESIKIELDNLQNDLINTIKSIKDKFLKEYLNEFDMKKSNCNNLIKEMQQLFELNETSNEILKRNMYKCQEYLNDLKRFDVNLNKKLNEISFQSSDWLPITSNIGWINGTSNLFTIAKAVSPNIINLSCCIKNIYGLCNLKDQYLFLTSPEENKIYILDGNYHCVKSCASVGGRYFSKPYSLCTDGQTNIFLCDYGNNRILIIDENFDEIRKVIGKNGTGRGEFHGPIDISYVNEQLFVLDEKNRRIQILSKRGEFLNEINFNEQSNVGNEPSRLCVISELLIVLDDFKNLIVFNYDGDLLQIIETEHISSLYVDDYYLLTTNDNGVIDLYEKTISKDTNVYQIELKRNIKNFEYDTAFTCFFNGHLIISLGEYASLAVF